MIRPALLGNPAVLGSMAALAAAFSYGAGALVARKVVSDFAPPMVGTAFSMLFGTLIVAALFHRHVAPDAGRAPTRAWSFVALAALSSAWGVSFWFLALDKAQVILVAPLVGTSPLISVALAHVFLQRLGRVTWRTVAGVLVVVGGVALIAVGSR